MSIPVGINENKDEPKPRGLRRGSFNSISAELSTAVAASKTTHSPKGVHPLPSSNSFGSYNTSGSPMDSDKTRVPDDRQKLLSGVNANMMDVEDGQKTDDMRRAPSSAYKSGKEAFIAVLQSWATKRFMTGCAILFPIAVTFYVTWWFFTFVDGFFSPIYRQVYGIDILGLGFVTTISFIFFMGVFVSSWVGSYVLWIGEWIIKRMPLMRHIYSASKQISNAISPDQNVNAFKEVAIIRHPRIGEYAFGFITSSVTLHHENGQQEELHSVYVPTNHVYIGDVFLVPASDIIRPNLSVREGLEIVVSGGMSMPKIIQPAERSPRMTTVVGFN
eukprot:TRINITY_DN45286_c0_g1_i1.p1 TRINITY_DN45286_c0_g1~~TRINITY_DN45286_c0_g1_i1.p1  ORF type:complete len:331 (-),score=7.56 TRINITY_DN45286_c0_g1_i1:131-1123(-)